MNQKELYKLIELPSEIVTKMDECAEATDLPATDECLTRLMNRESAASAFRDLKSILGDDDGSFKMLYCQLLCAARSWDRYLEKGIPQQIFTDTMKCFTRFLWECRRRRGRMFFDRGWWTYRQVSMSLFRIGALEYEFAEYEGRNVISVHIPSDADFSPASVDDSLERSKKFFSDFYDKSAGDPYFCESWLLSQTMRPLLSKTSNIRSFQDRFRIIGQDPDDSGFIGWLFEVPTDTAYNDLPEDTSLQRDVKGLLLNGGKVGTAAGFLKFP